MSATSESGFSVSGTWRQQFDWAVIEWNRDNTHEHPAFRYLPDGDLSGLVLTYEETRTNCIPMDSDLFPTAPLIRLAARLEDSRHHRNEEHSPDALGIGVLFHPEIDMQPRGEARLTSHRSAFR